MDILSYSIDIFHVLFYRIGIVKAEIASTAKTLCDPEVHADSLGVSDMKISVGFRRKTGVQSSAVLPFTQVIGHYLLYEVEAAGLRSRLHVFFFSHMIMMM